MKTLVAVRHIDFEDLDGLERVFRLLGFAISYLDAGRDALDDGQDADLLVVLGGPFAAYEMDRFPFLDAECRLIERRLAGLRPVLGVCLGAQLIARTLGARNYAGGRAEIGWSPVELTSAGQASALRHLEGASVLHWHGDTFDLPSGATHLASTPAYANQAFAYGPSVLGLQFHLEVTQPGFERWLDGHAAELAREGIEPMALRAGAGLGAPGLATAAAAVIGDWLDAQPGLGEPCPM